MIPVHAQSSNRALQYLLGHSISHHDCLKNRIFNRMLRIVHTPINVSGEETANFITELAITATSILTSGGCLQRSEVLLLILLLGKWRASLERTCPWRQMAVHVLIPERLSRKLIPMCDVLGMNSWTLF